MCHFVPKTVHLPQTRNFGLCIGLFQFAKSQKDSYSGSRVMSMHHMWAQNGPFAQTRIFPENLLINVVRFIHVCLHTKNQCQISIY